MDRNVILSILNDEPSREFAAQIFCAHAQGAISVAVSAANRVEYSKTGERIQDFDALLADCHAAGLIDPEILDYPLDWEMGLWEHGIISQNAFDLELAIHRVLHPSHPIFLSLEQSARQRRKITNAKCDVFAIWGHIYFQRDHFLSNDALFMRKKGELERLGARGISTPESFVLQRNANVRNT